MLRVYGFGKRPALLARAVVVEGAICAGQILTERTTAGLRGRLRGWRGGRGVLQRSAPKEALSTMSLREALALRRRRHSS